MGSLITNALYIFFVVLEIILFTYIIISWLPLSPKIKNICLTLVDPMLEPIRYFLNHSIFKTRNIDFAPIIAFIIISYLQQFFAS
ncbi:YggT family protein [Anaeromicropila herbilytica]|uniref:YggT family protein n=1 Tax=Anaeromicropila herbilytica TaxID=2785025 RepID=A0A7R7ELN7_9FIRM|nr:hypothetical protein bsdtb5_24910 [Anaeromicropila herbilytica]